MNRTCRPVPRAVVVFALLLLAPGLRAGADDPQSRATPHDRDRPVHDQAALEEFQQRMQAYLKLRAQLADKLEPLRTTPDAAELTARQESLAAALKVAREGARPGDLIPRPVADRIRAVVAEDLASRSREARASAFGEIPNIRLAVNRTYPKDAALPTVPPLLLKKLPPLPDNLQYRFANRHVVLLDGDTQLIVDYVTNALPPR